MKDEADIFTFFEKIVLDLLLISWFPCHFLQELGTNDVPNRSSFNSVIEDLQSPLAGFVRSKLRIHTHSCNNPDDRQMDVHEKICHTQY